MIIQTSTREIETPVSSLLLVAAILLALVGGLALAIAVPALDGPDEVYHWQRALQISEGQLLAARRGGQNHYGGEIGAAAVDFARWANRHFERGSAFTLRDAQAAGGSRSEGRTSASFPSTASFAPLAYLPQAAGIAVARGLGASTFAQLVAGRIANLLAYLALMAAAVRLAPMGQRVLLAVALTAPALHLAATVSGDPMNFALPALLIAWCLRLRLDPAARLTRASRIGLGLLILSLALLKPLFLLLAAIVWLVPERHFGGRRARASFLGWTLGAALLLSIAWNAAYPFLPGKYWGTGANPKAAIAGILAEPVAALGYFLHSLADKLPIMWLDGWGRLGGYPPPFMVNAPQALSWAGAAALLGLALAEGLRRRDHTAALAMAAIAAAFTSAVFVAFWIAFTPLGAPVIEGVQGRYLQLAFLLAGWAVIAAAPLGIRMARLRAPLLGLALSLQAAALVHGVGEFRFYWSS